MQKKRYNENVPLFVVLNLGGNTVEKDEITILIADDDSESCTELIRFVEMQNDMKVIGCAIHGEEAIKMILDRRPNIALIDSLMPIKDGLGVLEDLQKIGWNDTSCIIISPVGLEAEAKKAMHLGAKYYIMKPYQYDFLAGRIRMVYEGEESFKPTDEVTEYGMKHLWADETCEARISTLLNGLGISASIKGYYYIRSAVSMVLEDEEAIIGITKRMYPDIAKCYKTSASKVERAIRHAIESSWKKGGMEAYSKQIGLIFNDKPTNGHFIASIAEHVRLHTLEHLTYANNL